LRTLQWKKIFAMRHGDADCVLVGSNEQSIGTANQFAIISVELLIRPMSEKMSKEIFEDRNPSTLFREFAAECMESAQTASSPEKRALYMKMASVWHQMAQRWEKKSQPPP